MSPTQTSANLLLSPVTLGDLKLKNRIVMAPLTRCRATPERVPTALMAEYYRQRASAGLIISEATSVSPRAVGYPNTPGIWNQAQVDQWQRITAEVHLHGGQIMLQLWHVGRISDPMYLGGERPLAPSAIAARGNVRLVRPERPYGMPRPMTEEDIAEVIQEFKLAAANAMAAGFDGVEIHGANGYLLDQFLQSSTNQRTDHYGGSIANRARFVLEIVDAVTSVWPAGRVGMHLAPRCDLFDVGDDNPRAAFGYLAKQLGKRQLAFIFTREDSRLPKLSDHIKHEFGGPLIANEGLTPSNAAELVAASQADAVAFGKSFIANPDLLARIAAGHPLNAWDSDTFYSSGAKGYTDYPTM